MTKAFPEPPHEIRGATKVDQDWIDETIEAGATCCGWAVKPRPNGLDPAPKPVAVLPVKAPAKAPAKRKLLINLSR